MTYASCLPHPKSSRYLQFNAWQVDFCQGNHCAALLLSHFAAWHDWKILNNQYYRQYNNITESHGDGCPHIENAYLFFTMENLTNALMGFFGKKTISEGLELLVFLGVISVHKNPNPRYCFDKKKYFQFYPEVSNEWLQNSYPLIKKDQNTTQVVDNFDNEKVDNRSCKNALPASKRGQAITDTTNNNHSLKAREENFGSEEKPRPDLKTNTPEQTDTKEIVDALISKGMPSKRFYPDATSVIARLKHSGATRELFLQAFDKAERSTQAGNFGVNYLARILLKTHWPAPTKIVPLKINRPLKHQNTMYQFTKMTTQTD